ncbi:hypothetical protein [Ferruginibacter sp.]
MSTHKLHIFSKNRDAVAAQKGYSFQQLKTLEDWIENRIAGADEEIYCDFEDDIFSRNLSKSEVTFKQIKLYSTDFSFSSEAIKKAIAHFFSLYVKGEYSFDKTTFYFETNASVVGRDVKDNDAALLTEWNENQSNISDDLLKRIRIRVKKILGEYIAERVEELKENVDLKSDLQRAKNIYDNLTDEDFDAFTKSINWQFDDEETNEAVENILGRISGLIPKLPLPLDAAKTTIYSSLLVSEVFMRSIQDEPEGRKLTKDLLDAVLLSAGKKEDQWYPEAIQQFRGADITQFYPGEFQAAIAGARYCRWNQMDEGHKLLWIGVLTQYIELSDIPDANKRKAIYEYIFLKIGHDLKQNRTASPVIDDIGLINYYIANWKPSYRLRDIEDDVSFLQLIKSQILLLGLPFPVDQVTKWEADIKNYLETEAAKEKKIDRLCEILEIQGHLAHQWDFNDRIKGYKAGFEYYRRIPPLLDKTQYYSLTGLYDQLGEMTKMLIKHQIGGDLIPMIDEFMGEIQEHADKTGLRHKAAQSFIERGALYLAHHDLPNYLLALEQFHKAKEKWRLEYTKEGYIISLLGIASMYEALGMTFAAKYYSLVAFWNTWHFADPKLYKYLPKALSLVLDIDHKHGAWISGINDFEHYLYAKREFDEKGFDMAGDEYYEKAVFQMGTIMHAIPLLHPEMNEFVESLKKSLGFIWTDQISPLIDAMNKEAPDRDSLIKIVDHHLVDFPLNDVGAVRNIHFRALENSWHMQFENNESMAPIAEEFISFLQVTLCEIARINSAILNTGRKISIVIEKGHFQKQMHSANNWVITIPEFDSNETREVQMHYLYIGSLIISILQNISTVTNDEFRLFYNEELLHKHNLGGKVIEGVSYQRVFRNTTGASSELTKQKADFPSLNTDGFNKHYRDWLAVNKNRLPAKK